MQRLAISCSCPQGRQKNHYICRSRLVDHDLHDYSQSGAGPHLWIQKVRDDVSNRILEEKSFAGGKSVDVSKVLKNLGVDNIALGFVGGFAGRELEGRLLNEGIQTDFVHVSGETRTNIIIHEKETGKQLAFNARGPEIRPSELMEFVELLERLPCSDLVAIGGSLPPGRQLPRSTERS